MTEYPILLAASDSRRLYRLCLARFSTVDDARVLPERMKTLMKSPSRWLETATLCLLIHIAPLASHAESPTQPDTAPTSPFAKQNLHVWAFEEYDAVKRTPDQRAQLLNDLGIHRAGYICRNAKRTAEFEAYLNAYQKHGIELVGVWTPVHTANPLAEPQINGFLEVVDRYQIQIQWWLTLEHKFDQDPQSSRIPNAVNRVGKAQWGSSDMYALKTLAKRFNGI